MASFMTCSENQPPRKSALCWGLPGQRQKKKGVVCGVWREGETLFKQTEATSSEHCGSQERGLDL